MLTNIRNAIPNDRMVHTPKSIVSFTIDDHTYRGIHYRVSLGMTLKRLVEDQWIDIPITEVIADLTEKLSELSVFKPTTLPDVAESMELQGPIVFDSSTAIPFSVRTTEGIVMKTNHIAFMHNGKACTLGYDHYGFSTSSLWMDRLLTRSGMDLLTALQSFLTVLKDIHKV